MAVPLRTKKLPTQAARENRQSVGVSSLATQMTQMLHKKGFDFRVMVAGESGLGKSTLISTLFGSDKTLPHASARSPAAERVAKTVAIEKIGFSIEEKGVQVRMTVIDTPGFADAVNTDNSWQPIVDYIDGKYREYLVEESKSDRTNMKDERVHALLYFISPSAHGLKPLDLKILTALQYMVNIIPIVAKADTLTKGELQRLKDKVRVELQTHNIRVFVPDADDESSPLYETSIELETLMPFAVVGCSKTIEVGGRQLRGRAYPWGVVEVDNSEHCDFTALRKMLILTHTQELTYLTEKTLYENWRRETLAKNPKLVNDIRQVEDESAHIREQQLAEASKELSRRQEQMKRELEEQQRALDETRRQIEAERQRLMSMRQEHPNSSAI